MGDMMKAFVPLALGLGGGLLYAKRARAANSQDDDDDAPRGTQTGPSGQVILAGPPGTPEAMFQQSTYRRAFTAYDVQDQNNALVSTRYFSEEAAQIVWQMLHVAVANNYKTIQTTNNGQWYLYELKHQQPGPGVWTAQQVALNSTKSGYAIAVTINILRGYQNERVLMAIIPMFDRPAFGRIGEPWAIAFHQPDPVVQEQVQKRGGYGVPAQQQQPPQQYPQEPAPRQPPAQQYPQQPAPQQPPAQQYPQQPAPQQPPAQQYPQQPAPQQPPAQQYPQQPAPQQYPQQPPAQQYPQQPPAQQYPQQPPPPPAKDPFDGMPAQMRGEIQDMLKSDSFGPEVLLTAADYLSKDFPEVAAMLRTKAKGAVAAAELEDVKRGGYVYKLRSNDWPPGKLAEWYTGTPTGKFDGSEARYVELLPLNKGLKVHADGSVTGWGAGTEILLPLKWNARRKPVPPPPADPKRKALAAAAQQPAAKAPVDEAALAAVNAAQEAADRLGERSDEQDNDDLNKLSVEAQDAATKAKAAYQAGNMTEAKKQSERAANAEAAAAKVPVESENEEASLRTKGKATKKAVRA